VLETFFTTCLRTFERTQENEDLQKLSVVAATQGDKRNSMLPILIKRDFGVDAQLYKDIFGIKPAAFDVYFI
jgi:hypothetical protein